MKRKDTWDCEKCPLKFGSLRELNEHGGKSVWNPNLQRFEWKKKRCRNPNPPPKFYWIEAEKVDAMKAKIRDLEARVRLAQVYVSSYNSMEDVLNLRVKNWRKKFEEATR